MSIVTFMRVYELKRNLDWRPTRHQFILVIILPLHSFSLPPATMKKKKSPKSTPEPDMLPEYDFSNGERGRYAKHFAKGVTIIIMKPAVTKPKKKNA